MKTKIGFYSILLLAFSCQSPDNHSFETVDSQESYDMTNWSKSKKTVYYNKVGKYFSDYLNTQNYIIPSFSDFAKTLKSVLKTDISEKEEVVFLSHFLQKDKENQIVIFPKYSVLSFHSELPLADSTSLAYPNSKHFKEVSHEEENTFLLNQLLFHPKSLNLDNLLNRELTQEFFQTMVCDYHFSHEDKIFNHVIKKLMHDQNQGIEIENEVYLKLLFNRSKPEIDTEFVRKIAAMDRDRQVYHSFINSIKSEYPKLLNSLEKELDEIYGN